MCVCMVAGLYEMHSLRAMCRDREIMLHLTRHFCVCVLLAVSTWLHLVDLRQVLRTTKEREKESAIRSRVHS